MKNSTNFDLFVELNKDFMHPPAKGITVNFYTTPVIKKPQRNDPNYTYKKMNDQLKDKNLNKDKFSYVSVETFIGALKNGYPHIVADWKGIQRIESQIKGDDCFRTNILCFDIDCKPKEGKIENQKLIDLIKDLPLGVYDFEMKLNEKFHIVQRSKSWTIEYPSYHAYLLLDEEIKQKKDFDLVYKHLSQELENFFGIDFDHSITPFKFILAGQQGDVLLNRSLPRHRIPQELTINKPIKNVEKKERMINYTGVNNEALEGALRGASVLDIDAMDYFKFLAGLVNLELEGVLNTAEIEAIAEAVDDGNRIYLQKFEEFRRNPLEEIGVGTVIMRLKEVGVETNKIFTQSYEKESVLDAPTDPKINVRIDRFSYEGYLSDNEAIKNAVREAMRSEESTLLVAGTGAGKSRLIIDLLAEAHEEADGLKMFTTPRTKLKENLVQDFKKIPNSLAVDGTQLQNKEIDPSQIINNSNFLTTYDNAPTIAFIKRQLVEKPNSLNIIVTDETHMQITDCSFKANSVLKYRKLENKYKVSSEAKVSFLHITATAEALPRNTFKTGCYDRIIICEPKKQVNPFEKAEYYQFQKNQNNKTSFYAEMTLHRGKKLVFIENKELIQTYAQDLRKDGFNVVTITSESSMDEEALNDTEIQARISIVKKGLVPADVDIILATSTIGAGVSIVGTSRDWETWILINGKSRNSCTMAIKQYANRLRVQYSKLKLFVPYIEEKSHEHEYRLHQLAEEHVDDAIEIALMFNTEINMPVFGLKLIKDEKEFGLYFDEVVNVLREKIYSTHVGRRVAHNIANPKCIINNLERHYNCKIDFAGFVMSVDNDDEVEDKLSKAEKEALRSSIITNIMNNNEVLEDLKQNKVNSEAYGDLVRVVSKSERDSLKVLSSIPALTTEEYTKALGTIFDDRLVVSERDLDSDWKAYQELKSGECPTLDRLIMEVQVSGIVGKEYTSKELDQALQEVINNLKVNKDRKNKLYTPKGVRKYFEVSNNRRRNGKGRRNRTVTLNKVITADTFINRYGFDPSYGLTKEPNLKANKYGF